MNMFSEPSTEGIVLYVLFAILQWESMAALETEHRKLLKFGTFIAMVHNRNLTNFEVSRINSLAPPQV